MNEQQPMMQPGMPVSPTQPFSITLEAQQWNGVMAALVKAPYEQAAPLIQAIATQLQQGGSVPNGTGLPMAPPVN